MPNHLTIKDIAQKAGVSTATVGRVIHNRGYVSEEAREKVEKAIKEENYHLNLVAQALRRGRSKLIGHFVTQLTLNPYFAGTEQGIEKAVLSAGYNVIIWNSLQNVEHEKKGVEIFLNRHVDAIIFDGPQSCENVQMAKDAGVEVVQVERPFDVETHLVLIDNYAGTVEGMEHLFGLGHRKIAYIGKLDQAQKMRENAMVEKQRYQGYVDILQQYGVGIDTSLVDLDVDPYSVEDGYSAFQKIWKKHPDLTAVLVSCDILAAGVMQAIHEDGLRVPDDISVIGFDDTYAMFMVPALTSVAIPLEEVGITAARIALDALKNSDDPQAYYSKTLNTHLVIRKSTGAARN
ncbi:MAG: LacI family DNA-binding transcriptional regulator [Anaerolineaceae bacterium]|jgi:LacI family transcriptional regulator